jgi:acyl-CoA reductase-like NAD-dependent aldehyde dehydrogenase
VVLPDADVDATVKALTGAGFGAAGQRCMAVSAVVFVGGLERWKEPLLEAARSLKVRVPFVTRPFFSLMGCVLLLVMRLCAVTGDGT